MITKSGYGTSRTNNVSSEKTQRYKKLLKEPQKQQVSYTPVNSNKFIKDNFLSPEEIDKRIYTLPDGTTANKQDYTPEEQQLLLSGKYKINPDYDPNKYMSQKILSTAELKSAEQFRKEAYDNANALGKAQIIAGKVGNTAKDIVGSAGIGAISAAEGLANTGIAAVGNVANLVGAKDVANFATNMLKDDITGELNQKLDTATQSGYGRYNPSVLGIEARDIAQEAARMVTAGAGGTAGFIGSAIGGNTGEAIREGESLGRATAYGTVTGTIEGATEKLFDTFNLLGGGVLDKFVPKNVIAKFATGAIGEGIEEMISESLNPFAKILTYEGETTNPFASGKDFKEYVKNIGTAGWQGFVMGMFMQGVHDVSNAEVRKQYKEEVTKAVNKVKGLTQQQKQVAIDTLVNEANTSNIQPESMEKLINNKETQQNVLPRATETQIQQPKGEVINKQNINYSPVNARQVLAQPNINVTEQGTQILPKAERLKPQATAKETLIAKINNNRYLNEQEKNSLISQVETNQYSKELENGIQSILQSVNEQSGLKNINNNFKQNKATYGKYANDTTDYDKTYIETAKNLVPANNSGRRTKEQWLKIADNLGSQISNMGDSEIERLAYRTWIDNKPNSPANLNRQGQKYVKFSLDEWVNSVYESARQSRENIEVEGKPLALKPSAIYVTPEGQAMTTSTYSDYETGKLNLPTTKTNSVYQAAKGNVDVKIANRLMDIAERTNARVEGFYDENPDIEGSYKDGVIRINVNSEKAADTIFAHEFTHHLESTNAWNDVRDAIINSNTLYNMLSEQGINIDEYKQQIKDAYAKIKTKENPNGIILDDAGVEKEIVAKFVENNLMKDEKTIVRMINENPSFMQRLKNFWDDLVVRFKGTAEEKELRRIQNIYNKAFAEAQKGITQTKSNKTQFSLKTAIEEVKDLIAMHNLSAEKLKGILKLGGFPSPSIAVTKANIPHEGYGEITVLFNKDTINPANKYNEIYDRDVYSPRFPRVDVEINTDVLNNIDDLLPYNSKDEFLSRARNNYLDIDNATDKIDRKGINGYIDEIKGDEIFKYAYLKMNNPDFDYVYKNKYSNKETSEYDDFIEKYYKSNNKPIIELTHDEIKQLIPMINEARGKTLLEEAKSENVPEEWQNKYVNALSFANDDYAKADYYIDKVARYEKAKKRGDTVTVDEAKTKEKINKEINQKEYEKWVDEQFRDIVLSQGIRNDKDVFTPSGNRRTWKQLHEDYNLENVLKYITSQATTGTEEGFMGKGFGSIASQQAKRYASIDDIRKDKYKLKEFDVEHAELKKYEDELFEDIARLTQYHNAVNSQDWGITDIVSNSLFEFAKNKTQTVNGLIKELKADNFNTEKIPQELIEKTVKDIVALKDIPTQYFEAKPQRAVGFDEVAAIVMPKDTDSSLKEEIRDKGIEIVEYDSNIEGDRLRAVNSIKDIQFSVKTDSIETDKQTSTPKRYLSEHANTLLESGVTLPETRDVIAKMVEQGTLTHERITDKDAQAYAEKYIIENGFEDAVQHWNHLIKSNREMSKEELALGQMIYNNAEQARDVNLVKKMIADLVAEGTTAGRNLQAMSMVKRLTPDGRLYALERSVQKLNQQYRDEIGKKFKDIEIPNDLAEALLKSKGQKEIDANVEKIQQYIADQIPATWKDKLNAWRYLAMLGNTRTHIRNLAGNAVFIPAIEIKNAMALVGEKTLPTAERTKAILTKKDRALLDFAENDFNNNEPIIRGENKFDIASGVQEKRRIFDNKLLETLRKSNFAALEKEDTIFLKYHYKRAMARAIKAKGLSLEQLKSGSAEMNSKLSEIRNYAINEAKKATYRDFNTLAKWISDTKSRLKRGAAQKKGYTKLGYEVGYALAEGFIPFTKTPANIVKRIGEYSPLGIAKGILDMNTKVKSNDMPASQAIDELCSGLTGTGIVGLGILLASLGFITGGGEDKQKEEQFESLKGNQNYALKIGNKTYTIDWAAPSAVPLFVGVEIFNSLKNSENADVIGSFVKIVDPVFEMSMLQGINSALSAYGSDNAIGKAVSNMFQSYLGQYVPSLFGAVARTVDPVRRTTYADKNKMLPTGLQTFTQKQLQKIPAASMLLPTYKDQFGRDSRTDNLLIRIFSNFLSPGYLAEVKDKPVENELTRIYDKTGETDVLPSYSSKSITVDGEKINFTYEQYEKFATTRGDIAYKNLEKLFADARYKKLSDEEKVSAITKIYTYANEVAKSKVSDYKLTSEKARIEKQGNNYYKEVLK